eukprot:259453-Amorphochlora_amoeboformis.AAC.1
MELSNSKGFALPHRALVWLFIPQGLEFGGVSGVEEEDAAESWEDAENWEDLDGEEGGEGEDEAPDEWDAEGEEDGDD